MDAPYSCLAGFVEARPESAESPWSRGWPKRSAYPLAQLRYVGSQAWPYPGSLMLGYMAEADPELPGAGRPDEIALARWFTRAEVAAVLAGERDDFGLPMGFVYRVLLVSEWCWDDVTRPSRCQAAVSARCARNLDDQGLVIV